MHESLTVWLLRDSEVVEKLSKLYWHRRFQMRFIRVGISGCLPGVRISRIIKPRLLSEEEKYWYDIEMVSHFLPDTEEISV